MPDTPDTPDTTETPAEAPAAAPAETPAEATGSGKAPLKLAAFIGLGLLVAFALAFFVSPEASSEPDGLNKVAIDEGFADQETAHASEDSPLAGYGVEGVDNDRLSTGLAGIVGVSVTFVIMGGIYLGLRTLQRRSPASDDAAPPAPA